MAGTEFTWADPRIPEPEQRFLFVKCPRCGCRIWNQLFTQAIAYQAHYLGHVRADLEAEREAPKVTITFSGDVPAGFAERFTTALRGRRIR